MLSVGIGTIDAQGWVGGRYYLQHLIRCVASLPASERVAFYDVHWQQAQPKDSFAEVRPLMSGTRVLDFPRTLVGRAIRKARRVVTRSEGIADLFVRAGIDVLFPIPLTHDDAIPLAFWLPDFQHRYLKAMYAAGIVEKYDDWFDRGVEQAKVVVLSSRHALGDFERFYPESLAKARVLHFCSVAEPSWWELDPVTVANSKNLPERYLAISNQLTESKNHMIVFEALRILRDRGVRVDVVCTGSTADYRNSDYGTRVRDFLATHDLESQVFILGLLPRNEQIAVLRRSMAMLQPSRFEGWATAVEDAKSLGKAIVVSDLDVHREQLGDAHPWIVGVDDAEAWANAIVDVTSKTEPGPDRDAESRARDDLAMRMRECGERFVSIVREAAAR